MKSNYGKGYLSVMLACLLFIGSAAAVKPPQTEFVSFASVRWSYNDAKTGEKIQATKNVDVMSLNPAMKKSILVVKMAGLISETLAAYEALVADCNEGRAQIAQKVERKINEFEKEIPGLVNQSKEEVAKLTRAIENLRKLAKLMKDVPRRHHWYSNHYSLRSFRGSAVPEMAFAKQMRVTTGGAQDAQKFRDMLARDQVPSTQDFQAYGFINEFDLYVEGKACDSLLCMTPAIAFDDAAKKMYLQVNLGTNVNVDNFVRRPINVGIALDLSGSMEDNDQTIKTRLEWAKDAVNETLNNLVAGQDYFTLVYFSDDAKVLWSPIDPVTKKARPINDADKSKVRKIVADLRTIGSTNLRAGLDLTYQELGNVKRVLGKSAEGYESRVIMITDANLNTGDTDESSAVIEVEKQSRTRGINLTTVGIGENFFADFVNKISILRGSNYIFAQDGKRMMDYFKQFGTLVTPIAYDFVADVAVDGKKVKLVRVHGVPEVKAQAPKDSIVNISTLFFASPQEKGGGAQVLEFDLT